MALTFPSTDLASLLVANPDHYAIEVCEFDLMERQKITGLQSGDLIVKEFVSPRWHAMIATSPVEYKYWKKIRARLLSLRGAINTLYLWDTIAEYPEEDPTGSILAASAVTIHTIGGSYDTMRLQGLPNAYQLREGDALSFKWDGETRTAYHVLTEDALAATGGVTPAFGIVPNIRVGAAVNAAVTLKRPVALMRLQPGSGRYNNAGPLTGRISFEAIQVL